MFVCAIYGSLRFFFEHSVVVDDSRCVRADQVIVGSMEEQQEPRSKAAEANKKKRAYSATGLSKWAVRDRKQRTSASRRDTTSNESTTQLCILQFVDNKQNHTVAC